MKFWLDLKDKISDRFEVNRCPDGVISVPINRDVSFYLEVNGVEGTITTNFGAVLPNVTKVAIKYGRPIGFSMAVNRAACAPPFFCFSKESIQNKFPVSAAYAGGINFWRWVDGASQDVVLNTIYDMSIKIIQEWKGNNITEENVYVMAKKEAAAGVSEVYLIPAFLFRHGRRADLIEYYEGVKREIILEQKEGAPSLAWLDLYATYICGMLNDMK